MLSLVDRLSKDEDAEFMHRTQEIRPVRAEDRAAIGDFFGGLSVRSRYLRFFAPVVPGGALLALLSGDGGTDTVLALCDGIVVGHAMAVDRAGPGSPVTDVGVVVADAWQGRGVGSALMRALLARAQARGVTSASMDVLPGNRQVLAMIARHWPAAGISRSADFTTVCCPLPPLSAPSPPHTGRSRRRQPAQAARP
jgi:GNAT superfamily N-acetyltransferase